MFNRVKSSKVDLTKQPDRHAFWHKNVLPMGLGLAMVLAVLALLNVQLISAQLRYHFWPPNAVAIAATPDHRAPESGEWLMIPAIGVKAPVNEVNSFAEWRVEIALRSGVVHYAGTADPGQAGNTVIFGHSSGPPWSPGKFNFVFTLLSKTKPGDQVIFDFNGTRYIYQIYSHQVVNPYNLSALESTDYPQLTLITCTPVGTSQNRLVVRARQVSPSPATATPMQANPDRSLPDALPGD